MIRLKPVRQSNEYFCGPAALSMVLAEFGMKKTQKELARVCGTTRFGTHAKDLAACARRFGLHAFVKDDAALADLRHWVKKKKVPVIVAWFFIDEGHYSVVTHIDTTHIVLQDPSTGRKRTMSAKTFLGIWFDFRGPYIKRKTDLVLRRMIVIHPKGIDKVN